MRPEGSQKIPRVSVVQTRLFGNPELCGACGISRGAAVERVRKPASPRPVLDPPLPPKGRFATALRQALVLASFPVPCFAFLRCSLLASRGHLYASVFMLEGAGGFSGAGGGVGTSNRHGHWV